MPDAHRGRPPLHGERMANVQVRMAAEHREAYRLVGAERLRAWLLRAAAAIRRQPAATHTTPAVKTADDEGDPE